MGTKITAKFPGTCKECDISFKKGEEIYYQKEPKVACKNHTCEAVVKLYINEVREIIGTKSYKDYRNLPELKMKIVKDVTPLDNKNEEVNDHLAEAHYLAKQLYPGLEAVDAQTFGQIRSKIVDWRIALEHG